MVVNDGTSLVICPSRRRYDQTLPDMVPYLPRGQMSPTIPGEGKMKAVKS
jgi:hypothetical protein